MGRMTLKQMGYPYEVMPDNKTQSPSDPNRRQVFAFG